MKYIILAAVLLTLSSCGDCQPQTMHKVDGHLYKREWHHDKECVECAKIYQQMEVTE